MKLILLSGMFTDLSGNIFENQVNDTKEFITPLDGTLIGTTKHYLLKPSSRFILVLLFITHPDGTLMFIIVRNRHSNLTSNPGQGHLHFI